MLNLLCSSASQPSTAYAVGSMMLQEKREDKMIIIVVLVVVGLIISALWG